MKNQNLIIAVLIVVVVLVLGWMWPRSTPVVQNNTVDNSYKTIAKGQYFGNEVRGDFDNNEREDVAFIYTDSPGGSGTFYYVIAAMGSSTGFVDTNSILLGDRIAPQSTEYKDGKIVVNYADRKATDPMTTKPSVGVTKYFQVTNGNLVEVGK
jgi:hypothetical protein